MLFEIIFRLQNGVYDMFIIKQINNWITIYLAPGKDELIEFELLELEQPDEQPIEVSDDENVSISPKKISKKLNQTSITRFLSKVI